MYLLYTACNAIDCTPKAYIDPQRAEVHRKEGDDNMYVPLEIVPSDVEEDDERYA